MTEATEAPATTTAPIESAADPVPAGLLPEGAVADPLLAQNNRVGVRRSPGGFGQHGRKVHRHQNPDSFVPPWPSTLSDATDVTPGCVHPRCPLTG